MLAREQLKAAIEAVLFARSEPISAEEMGRIVGVSTQDARIILNELCMEYNDTVKGIQVNSSREGYAMCTHPDYHEYVKKANPGAAVRLSQAALETLAIIAYRQPLTRPEMEAVRGVKVDRVLNSLLARGLIEELGKKEGPGRPILYGTTPEFLKLFGLTSLEDLPQRLEEAEPHEQVT
ncbi:MAG: SMC-Scp complex subunit ScpB [Acidobacteriota bacterium]